MRLFLKGLPGKLKANGRHTFNEFSADSLSLSRGSKNIKVYTNIYLGELSREGKVVETLRYAKIFSENFEVERVLDSDGYCSRCCCSLGNFLSSFKPPKSLEKHNYVRNDIWLSCSFSQKIKYLSSKVRVLFRFGIKSPSRLSFSVLFLLCLLLISSHLRIS